MDWAHVAAMRAFFLMQRHDTSHRFDACCPAVRRSRLRAAQSWSNIQNNKYDIKTNAYNSFRSAAYYVDLA